MKEPRVAVLALIAQSGCQEILKKQNISVFMTHSTNSKIEAKFVGVIDSAVKAKLCFNHIL